MKIIDEKGKLFGKINLIDLLVLALVLVLAAALCLKLLGRKAPGDVAQQPDQIAANEEMTVRFDVFISNVSDAYLPAMERYAKGASLVRDNNVINGKIVDFKAEKSKTNLGPDGTLPPDEDNHRCDLTFTIEYTGKMHANALVEGEQVLRVGSSYAVRTTMIEVTGYIINLEILEG